MDLISFKFLALSHSVLHHRASLSSLTPSRLFTHSITEPLHSLYVSQLKHQQTQRPRKENEGIRGKPSLEPSPLRFKRRCLLKPLLSPPGFLSSISSWFGFIIFMGYSSVLLLKLDFNLTEKKFVRLEFDALKLSLLHSRC